MANIIESIESGDITIIEAADQILKTVTYMDPDAYNVSDIIPYEGIIPLGEAMPFHKINKIHMQNKMIELPSDSNNLYEYEFTADDQPELEDHIPEGTPMGFLINAQMQHSMVIEITEKVPDNQPSSLLA